MCIYCSTTKYRKIYEHHHGSIPKEENGRTYEIHHIDGNHSNNNFTNLKAITLEDHYNIHLKQKDYFACWMMSKRMKLTPEEISQLSKSNNKKRILDKTHNFLGESNPVYTQIKNGTHNLTKEMIDSVNERHRDRVKNGTHHLLDGTIQKKSAGDRIENKSHNLLGKNNPRFDSTIYIFQHKSGIIVESTQNELIQKYSLDHGHISKLVKGIRKSHREWIIISFTE